MKMSRWWFVLGLGFGSASGFGDGVQTNITPELDVAAATPVAIMGAPQNTATNTYMMYGATSANGNTMNLGLVTVVTAEEPSPAGTATSDSSISAGSTGVGLVSSYANDVDFVAGSCTFNSTTYALSATFTADANQFPKYRQAYSWGYGSGHSCAELAALGMGFQQEVTISSGGTQTMNFNTSPAPAATICVFGQPTGVHSSATLPRTNEAVRIDFWPTNNCSMTLEHASR